MDFLDPLNRYTHLHTTQCPTKARGASNLTATFLVSSESAAALEGLDCCAFRGEYNYTGGLGAPMIRTISPLCFSDRSNAFALLTGGKPMSKEVELVPLHPECYSIKDRYLPEFPCQFGGGGAGPINGICGMAYHTAS